MCFDALVVDDEVQVRQFVSRVLTDDGWSVTEADSAEQAFALLPKRNWALVLCDVMLGRVDGLSVLKKFKAESPETKVVLMTGHGSAHGALDAAALGAYDYLLKPVGVEALQSLSFALKEGMDQRDHSAYLDVARKQAETELVGRSSAFVKVMKQVGRVAATSLPVLLTGESGTGKEVVASALHRRSSRAEQPFVAVNCAAIPSELIESELFGHVKGAFTGADRNRVGLWEAADGGTVFLDEITETSAAFQVKLLRALQEGEIRRVGSNRTQQVDVRVVAASNRDVEVEVKAGRFRQDLFYRLNAVSIVLPPLRERTEDIFPLAIRFAEQVNALNPDVTFAADALEVLQRYPWPGNVRELENAVVRAGAMCDGTIRVEDLPERVRNFEAAVERAVHEVSRNEMESSDEWLSWAEVEGKYVARVLEHTRGNKQAAARLLTIDRKTLDRMIKRHNIHFGSVTRFPTNRLSRI